MNKKLSNQDNEVSTVLTIPPVTSGSHPILDQELVNFFCKGPDNILHFKGLGKVKDITEVLLYTGPSRSNKLLSTPSPFARAGQSQKLGTLFTHVSISWRHCWDKE